MKRLLQFGIAIERGGACLCAGEISAAGLYAKGAEYCLCRGRPAGRVGDPGNGCKNKCDKYVHLGMELAGTRDLGMFGKLRNCPT